MSLIKIAFYQNWSVAHELVWHCPLQAEQREEPTVNQMGHKARGKANKEREGKEERMREKKRKKKLAKLFILLAAILPLNLQEIGFLSFPLFGGSEENERESQSETETETEKKKKEKCRRKHQTS